MDDGEKHDEGGEEAVVDSSGHVWTRIDHDPPYWLSEITGESRWERPA